MLGTYWWSEDDKEMSSEGWNQQKGGQRQRTTTGLSEVTTLPTPYCRMMRETNDPKFEVCTHHLQECTALKVQRTCTLCAESQEGDYLKVLTVST